jgi:hypothetical protein
MLFIIYCDYPMMMQIKRFPVVTVYIIALNAVIFAIGLLLGSQTQIIQNYGFIPNHLFYVSNNANDDGNNNNISFIHTSFFL